jgi:inner membrane protein
VARRARPRGRPAPLRTALPDGTFRRLVVVSLVVGSNLPDADLAYTTFAGGPLTYVLQHRGYTHTLVGAFACAALLWLACALWLRWRGLRATAAEQAWIGAAAVTGVLLHLAMDYTNSYGVHPFLPFADHWVYGDSVFIVEPLMWLAAVPLVFVLESFTARVLVGVALFVGAAAVLLSGLVAPAAMLGFATLGVAMLAVGRWLRPAVALGCGIACWLAVTALFAFAGRVATQRLDAAARQEFPRSRTMDRVLTPTAADPLCWDSWLVQQQGDEEIMRQVRISLLPRVVAVGNCRGFDVGAPRGNALAATAGPNPASEPVPAADAAGIHWQRQFRMPTDQIAKLTVTQCRARAFMQFARVPLASGAGTQWWLTDLRFGGARGFAQLHLTQPPQTCDFSSVPWLPPRPELLQSLQGQP